MRSELDVASLDFVHRLSLENDDSDFEETSNSASPCKPMRNAQLFRHPLSSSEGLSAKENHPHTKNINNLNSYSFSSALKHAGRASSRKHQSSKLHPLLDLKQPSMTLDDPYSPLQSPTGSIQSLTSLTSSNTSASVLSELDSDFGTEVETDGELEDQEGNKTEIDLMGLSSVDEDEFNDSLVDTPVARPLSRMYPLGHRVNRSVLGIPLSHHNQDKEIHGASEETSEHREKEEIDAEKDGVISPLSGPRSRTNPFRRSVWMPPTKVRRTQSMFATPEQMLHEQQLGNVDRAPANQPEVYGISYLDSPECPIPTFTVRQDPFPRITHETLCRLIDGEFRGIFPEVLVIDCRFEYEYEGGHIDGAINVNSKQQLEQALFGERTPGLNSGKRLLIFHCEYSAYRSPLLASHLRYCDRNINAATYPNLCYPDVLVLDGGYSQFYNAASHRCVPQNYVGMNHQAHQNTCQREMSRFRSGMKTRKFQSFGMISTPQLDEFKFPAPKPALHSASVTDLHNSKPFLDPPLELDFTPSQQRQSHNNNLFGF